MNLNDLTGKFYKGNSYVFASNRLASFGNWPYDADGSCSAVKVAEAGFINTTTKKQYPCAACAFCEVELEFEEDDDPWREHVKRGDKCEFVQLNKLDERTWTVKDYMELLGAAHVNVVAKTCNTDYENCKLASGEVKALVATLKK